MAEASKTLSSQFIRFSNFGNHGQVEKKTMTNKNLTKMFKDCELYQKGFATADTDIAFNKVKERGKKEITLSQLKELIKAVAPRYKTAHKLENEETAYEHMVQAIMSHDPVLHGTTSAVKSDVVMRMTDHKQYTGTHKERFDEAGKGKGIGGREELNAKDGYVQGYKEKGTYDQKQQ